MSLAASLGGFVAALGVALLTYGAVSAQTVPVGNARLEAPTGGVPGQGLSLSAEGFTPGAEIQLFLMGPGPAAYLLPTSAGSAMVGRDGRASWTVQLPENIRDAPAGDWWLSADDLEGKFANRPFTVASLAPVAAQPTAGAATPVATSGPIASQTPVATTVATPGGQVRVVVTSRALRLRLAPSVSAPVVREISAETQLVLLQGPFVTEEADFYQVRLPDGAVGYAAPLSTEVAAATLMALPTVVAGTPTLIATPVATATPVRAGSGVPTVSPALSEVWGFVRAPSTGSAGPITFRTTVALWLRAEPSANAVIVGPIRAFALLELLDRTPTVTQAADYYRVRTSTGATGYAAAEADDLPAVGTVVAGAPLRSTPAHDGGIVAMVPAGLRVLATDFVSTNFVENWVLLKVDLGPQGVVEGYLHGGSFRIERTPLS